MGPVPALSNVGQVSSGTSSVDLLLASTGGDLRSVRPRRDAAPILSVTARRNDALVAWVAHRATHADTREFRDSDGFTMDERAVKTAESFRDAVDVVFERVLVLF